jgi:hypothetical protein
MVQDVIYKYVGNSRPEYESPFTVSGAWVDWLRQTWINALTAAGFVAQAGAWFPTYEQHVVYWPANDGKVVGTSLNPFETPTRETCDYLAVRYGGSQPLVVIEVDYVGPGPMNSKAKRRYLQWPNGVMIPAGSFAAAYTNNPADKNNVADLICRAFIAQAGAA